MEFAVALPDDGCEYAPDATWSKIGGAPLGMTPEVRGAETLCPGCGRPRALLTEMYCPLADGQRRLVAVFVCVTEGCTAPRFVARRFSAGSAPEVEVEVVEEKKKEEALFEEEAWSDGEAWDDGEEEEAVMEDEKVVEKKIVAVKDESPVETVVMDTASEYFRQCFVDFVPRSSVKTVKDKHLEELIARYKREFGDMEDEDGPAVEEGFEAGAASVAKDKAYRKFEKELAVYPSQIARWDFGGSALQISDRHPLPTEVPPCPRCGGKRVFELQLLPSMVNYLKPCRPAAAKKKAKKGDEPMSQSDFERLLAQTAPFEFGTICVFCCEGDCATDNVFVDEHTVFTPPI